MWKARQAVQVAVVAAVGGGGVGCGRERPPRTSMRRARLWCRLLSGIVCGAWGVCFIIPMKVM